MNVSELVGTIVTAILREELSGDADDGGARHKPLPARFQR